MELKEKLEQEVFRQAYPSAFFRTFAESHKSSDEELEQNTESRRPAQLPKSNPFAKYWNALTRVAKERADQLTQNDFHGVFQREFIPEMCTQLAKLADKAGGSLSLEATMHALSSNGELKTFDVGARTRLQKHLCSELVEETLAKDRGICEMEKSDNGLREVDRIASEMHQKILERFPLS